MLMKQSNMQFQEIQILSLDNGCPEQLQHYFFRDINVWIVEIIDSRNESYNHIYPAGAGMAGHTQK